MFLLFLIGLGAANVNAQVTIGASAAPDKFSLLDLVTTNVQKGIHMPRLTTAQRNALIAATAADSTNAKGLAVFNTTTNCYDVWNGKQWLSLCDAVNSLKITVQPAPFTFRRLYDSIADPNSPATATPVTLSVTATGNGTLSYKWYQTPRNINSTVHGAVLGTAATYSPPVTAWGMNSYYCVVSNGTDSIVSNIADVAIGCGAKTINGGWVIAMCQNLGAAPAPTALETTSFAVDTTSSDAKGWLFQWGRASDGHQFRSSLLASGPVDSLITQQIQPSDTLHYGKFITTTDAFTFIDWRSPQSTQSPGACPLGWMVPSQGTWAAIFNGVGTSNATSRLRSNDGYFNGFGLVILPDGVTPTLFLPYAGYRQRTGFIADVGVIGYYYTSSPAGNGTYITTLGGGFLDASNFGVRAAGTSVRCVKAL